MQVQTVVKIWLASVLVLFGSWTVALGQGSSYSTAKSDLETIRKSPDTTKAKLLLNFAKDHYSSDDSIVMGLKYLLESYQISQKNNYTIGIIKSAYELGSLYAYSKNILQSNDYYLISLKYAEANNLIQFKASALMGLGLNYYTQVKMDRGFTKI